MFKERKIKELTAEIEELKERLEQAREDVRREKLEADMMRNKGLSWTMSLNVMEKEIEAKNEALRKRDEQELVLRKLNAITNEDLDRERAQREELERELEAYNAREEELNGVIAEMQQALEEERATKAKLEEQLLGLADGIVKL